MKRIKQGNLLKIDLEVLAELDRQTIKNAKNVNDIVLNIVNKVTGELDALVFTIKEDLKKGFVISTETLEQYALEISVYLYYLGQSQEYIGLRHDVSKAIYKERYAEAYANAIGTISDKTAYAENEVNYEFVEQSINERAYKRLKIKIENATELLQTIKKIISRRIAEYNLTNVSGADIENMQVSKKEFNVVGRRN